MADEVLPASLEKLEIDRTSANGPRANAGEKAAPSNPFGSSGRIARTDTSDLFGGRSMANRPIATFVSPRGVRGTTNFKPSKSNRILDRPRKNSIIKEAVLKLNDTGMGSACLSETLASTLLKEACRLSITGGNCRTFGHGSASKDFGALGTSNKDRRRVKNDASGSFQRARSNTMPNLKREGPGPGGGNCSSPSEIQTSSASGQSTSSSNTCSIQARISPPSCCDVTIDELASYFEEFVHIPKKMSDMAEMMYI